MEYGVVFPQTEIGADPAACRDFAQAAEELGFDGLMAYDHVLGADRSVRPDWSGWYALEDMFHEPFVLFSHLAAITRRIRFVTGILILPQRQTVLVAKQAAAVDVMSNGRFTLGVGVGWNAIEFEGLGESFGNRGARCEEQIDVLRALWTHRSVHYEGRWHQIPHAGINPMPVQQPIPVWIGGTARPVLERAARMADGWLPMGRPGPSEPLLDRLRGLLETRNRGTSDFAIVPIVELQAGWDGTARDIEAWRKLGATHLYFDGTSAGSRGPSEHIAAIERFRSML